MNCHSSVDYFVVTSWHNLLHIFSCIALLLLVLIHFFYLCLPIWWIKIIIADRGPQAVQRILRCCGSDSASRCVPSPHTSGLEESRTRQSTEGSTGSRDIEMVRRVLQRSVTAVARQCCALWRSAVRRQIPRQFVRNQNMKVKPFKRTSIDQNGSLINV